MSGKLNKKNNHNTNIYTSSNKKIVIIKHKYRQLTWGFLKTILSKNIRNHTKGSLAKVSSQIKLQTLFQEKPHNRHSLERSRIQSGYLWIDKYTSCNCSSVYKTCTINKNLTDISVTSFLFRIRINLTVPKLGSFISYRISAVFLGFGKRVTLQFRRLYLTLIWVGFLGDCFKVSWVKLTPSPMSKTR